LDETIGGLRNTRHRGADRVGWVFTFAAAACNLVRMRNLWPIATKRTPEPADVLLSRSLDTYSANTNNDQNRQI
jgi:hypothetical protein